MKDPSSPVSAESVARWTRWCIATLIVLRLASLVVIHLLGHDSLHGVIGFLDLGAEQSLATWYSTIQLAAAAAVVAAIARRWVGSAGMLWRWRGLAAFMALLSLDEQVQLHERMDIPLRHWLGADMSSTWVLGGLAVALVFAGAMWRWLHALPSSVRRAVMLAGAIAMAGAFGVELVATQHAIRYGLPPIVYHLLVVLEEGLEMSGIALFLVTMVGYLDAMGRPEGSEPDSGRAVGR